ncbi:MAG: DNA-binding response OmpR family regulator [Neptuniibacter pectenicola]|jgi:DNA-binding response OmpR family regulator|uniref:response regulator transcription factor n=1 Tax=Neptuniibacter pectenicola TaxID=1806669 RepID=UPI000791A23C|nr:MAG: two-component system response regulator [Neptuniibacter sp. Phe_28]|tara:strand:+ start:2822 stop:3520 length:699 start_codon:yes stop_codon:yes gene_type:complete
MKILIAEDDLNIRMGLSDLLDNEGYTCLEAENGEAALSVYIKHQPDLVLLDIMMPIMDGYTVCRKIRQLNETVPVIFITAKSEEIDQVLGLELGADDYIKKPFGTREVIARIKAVARRCRPTPQPKVSPDAETFWMNDLHVLPAQLQAQRDAMTFELSLRDLKILQLLHREKGKVVDRDMLFNECWGRDYLPSSRTLDQHISKLRKVIELDAKAPKLIQTVHGIGYRFNEHE